MIQKLLNQVEQRSKDFLGLILEKREQQGHYQQAIKIKVEQSAKLDLEKVKASFKTIHEEVARQILEDLQSHMQEITKITDENPRIVEILAQDINCILQGLPDDMSIEEFCALAYVYRSYEKGLILDEKRWHTYKPGKSPSPTSSKYQAYITTVQSIIFLNYYREFYDHLARIEKITGFEGAGKRIRQLEFATALTFFKLQHSKEDILQFTEKCQFYINFGNPTRPHYRCQPFKLAGAPRFDAPDNPPPWLLEALNP